jgi:GxxExxY protein
LSFGIIGAAMEVHKILGPGFLESIYQLALEKELSLRGIPFQQQVELPVSYKGTLVGIYKADLIIDNKIVLEIKGIARLALACCDRAAACDPHQFWNEFFGVSPCCQVGKQKSSLRSAPRHSLTCHPRSWRDEVETDRGT